MPPGMAPPGANHIRLRVPALRAFGGLTPLTASGLAERAGFSAAEIERLVQAIGHTVEALVDALVDTGHGDGDVLDVEFALTPGHLVVDLAAAAPQPAAAGPGLSPEDWRRLDRRVAPLVTKVEPITGGARLSFGGVHHPT
ncbi:MAG: hypothetical protein IT196_18350 [Acidimicrobiales bacterium]|nr:hypothetical protein [Acidimicrobiales bacterium]